MKGWSDVKDFFGVTKKDRTGLLAMALLILVLFVLPDLPQAEKWLARTDSDTSWMAEWRQFLDTINHTPTEKNKGDALLSASDRPPPRHVLFPFDPNTLTEEGWKKLGLRPKTIQTILNYRHKGGVFRKPEDLGRVYGLFPDEYERLKPFIDIQQTVPAAFKDSFSKRNTATTPAWKTKVSGIDINVADSMAWEALPGIGPKLAQRIVRFREALGGFYSIEQVGETFGLPDSTFQKIRPMLLQETVSVKQVNINHAPEADLSSHPYLGKKLARLIVAYRTQHGSFTHIETLQKIPGFDEGKIERLRPYMDFER